MKIVTIDPSKCVACRNCEYACSFQQSKDFKRRDANIRVNFYPEEVVCIPLTCVHCSDAWCLEVCPAGAINRNEETGAVEIDSTRCAGCKMCMLACPFGNIYFHPQKQVSMKCDLCGGAPKCVKFCISGALQFEDDENAFQHKREHFDAHVRALLRQDRQEAGGI